MFSAKLLTSLTLVFLVINAVAGMNSQCSQWKAEQGNKKGSKVVIAKLMTTKNKKSGSKPHTKPLIGPPKGQAGSISSDDEAVCPAFAKGYVSEDVQGLCLWTGEAQGELKRKGVYAGWVRGDHTENCAKDISLTKSNGQVVHAPVIDGCRFAGEGETITEDVACRMIWVTKATLKALGAQPGQESIAIQGWDFTNGSN
ncbi:hypothetical protein PGTUg99_029691 [Puccinia graminis f. sp. tritici]|uniref:Ecp2 effector protein domain-containing protein n=1 Tax=Puccinia graminis f. sp. tritici TaxID=56615 RepID=A0A5B0RGR0_PUCGR|nr:hypothetical protein PGTUg99_029691 [Puccinia graminis f. sp. tritici]